VGHQLSVFLAHYGLLSLFVLTLVKAIGVPIPIPADLVVLAAATGSASGKLNPWQALGVLLVAMVGGGIIQFGLARGPGRNILYRYGHFVGLTKQRLDLAFQRVENVGVLGIAVAVVTPAIRTAAIPACGLTTIRLRTYALGLLIGTSVYLAFQFFLAYGIVKLLLGFWNSQQRAWLWLVIVPVAAVAAWVVIRHRTRHLGQLSGSVPEEDSLLRSHRCPLCWLTIAEDSVARRQGSTGSGELTPPPPEESARPLTGATARGRASVKS
jgi:membrane protein DedA with SNARE-associated domain